MRVNLDLEQLLSDPRFWRLLSITGLTRSALLGVLTLAWLPCYQRRTPNLSAEDIDFAAERDGFAAELLQARFATQNPDGTLRMAGVEERIRYLTEPSSRAGGLARAATATRKGGKFTSKLPASTSVAGALDQRPPASTSATSDIYIDHSDQGAPGGAPPVAVEDPPWLVPLGADPPSDRGSSVPARQRSNGRTRHVPVDRARTVVDDFHDLFLARRGAKPTWNGKTTALAHRLAKEHGADEVIRRAEIMFDQAGSWPVEHGGDLVTLAQHFDRFATPPPMKRRGGNEALMALAEFSNGSGK